MTRGKPSGDLPSISKGLLGVTKALGRGSVDLGVAGAKLGRIETGNMGKL